MKNRIDFFEHINKYFLNMIDAHFIPYHIISRYEAPASILRVIFNLNLFDKTQPGDSSAIRFARGVIGNFASIK